jgi:hypothetical protein
MKAVSYPKQIEEGIRQTTGTLGEVSGLVSVLLLGSTARAELAYAELDGRLEIFSDYEFLAVTERRLSSRERQDIARRLAALERDFAQRNPLFHIDVIFRERHRLRSMPPIIFTYELKANAQVLEGEDVRSLLPEVTLENLDLRNTNEILIKRLWAVLLHLPRRFVLGPASEAERRVAGYVLCRNALDLTTVLLPHGGVLLPTYRERVAHLGEHYGELRLASTLGPALPSFLHDCLERRLDLDFGGRDLQALYRATVGYLERGLETLCSGGEPLATELEQRSRNLFNEWPISRGEWYNLVRITLMFTRRGGPLRALRWLRLPKKGRLALGLLAMHKALLAWFAGRTAQAEQRLTEARHALHPLSITAVPELHGNFGQRWLALRTAWGEFWRQYIRLGEPSYARRFQEVMSWTYE